jgi:tetratricopeptide (TPR) repeat protein
LFAIGYLAGFDHPRLRWRVLAYLSFALAALSKEVALATPAVAFFLSAIRNDNTFKERVRVVFPAVPILMTYIVIRVMVVPVKPSNGPPNGWQEHIFGALGGLSRYLGMLVWPGEQCAYLQTPVSSSLADPWAAMGLAIILGAVYLWLVHKPVGQMAFAALLSFVPMANIVRVAAPRNMGFPMSERFLYLPSLVVVLAMGFTWVYVRDRLPRNTVKRGSRLVAVLVIVAFGLLTARTLERNKVWKDELAMFTDAKSKVENAPLIDWQLASVYRRKGFLNKAQSLVFEAVQNSRQRRMPIPAPMIVTLATATAQNGDVRGAIRVLERYQRETGAKHAMISYNLGVLKEELGQNKEALSHYRQAYTLRPKYVPAYMSAGVSLLRMGKAQETIGLMENVHALDPRNASAWHAQGLAQRKIGEMDQALASFLMTIKYKPSVVAPRIDAAAILLNSDPERALDLLIAVQSEHPNHKKLEAAIGIVRERIGQ